MSRNFGILAIFAALFSLSALAQQAQQPCSLDSPNCAPADPNAIDRHQIDPKLQAPNDAPRSDDDDNAPAPFPKGAYSSSKDSSPDLSPPPGDAEHPGSPETPPADVTEMKPWNPHQADKDVEIGLYYFKRHNYKAAESRYREALHWQDNHAEANYRLGEVLDKEGRASEARPYYEAYLKILPDGPFAKDCHKALDRKGSKSDTQASTSQLAGTSR